MLGPNTNLLMPYSEWEVIKELPDLSAAKTIAVDLETCDPLLKDRGPGWATGEGTVAGIAFCTDYGLRAYLPIAHSNGVNLDSGRVLEWARTELGRSSQLKVCHNATYDIGWLRRMGVAVAGPVADTQLLASLLDENRRQKKKTYTLDELGKDYLGEQKDESLLRDAARSAGVDPKAEMYKLPPEFVGAYAEQDAALTLKLYGCLNQLIQDQGLSIVADLENALIPISLGMRWNGVAVDVSRAEKLLRAWQIREAMALDAIKKMFTTGVVEGLLLPPTEELLNAVYSPARIDEGINIWSNKDLARLFDKFNLPYPRTEKGAPSFEKEFLSTCQHPAAVAVAAAKRINKGVMYVKEQILGSLDVHNRIHPSWNQLVDDDYGTISGRYSCSRPNFQQMPKRDPEVGPHIRSLFLPYAGSRWGSFDYSQQEPRLTVHYACIMQLEGAEEAAQYYRESEDADYHAIVSKMAGIPRSAAKEFNLGLAYGMGKAKLGRKLGLSNSETDALWDAYHAKLPYIRSITGAASRKASADGYVKTILGRKCRFDLWEPKRSYDERQREPLLPQPRELAEALWPNTALVRAYTYRAFNRVIQGSAADQTKKAMVDCGVMPLAQVHDELCFAITDNKEVQRIKEAMIESVPLMVPVKVDVTVGDSWGG